MRISDWSSDVCSSDLEPQVWVVWRRLLEQRLRAGEQIAVQPARLARPRDFAGPDVQPARLLAVLSQLLEALLYPLPPLQLLPLGQRGDLKVLLRVALEHAGAAAIGHTGAGMTQGLGVVYDELSDLASNG